MAKDKKSNFGTQQTVYHGDNSDMLDKNVVSSSSRLNWSGKKFLKSFDGSSSGFTFVKFIFVVFFAFVIFEFLVYQKFFTFSALLDKLSTYESSSFSSIASWLGNQMYINGNWGVFDFFRKFLNLFSHVFSLFVNLIGGFMDILKFLFFMIN